MVFKFWTLKILCRPVSVIFFSFCCFGVFLKLLQKILKNCNNFQVILSNTDAVKFYWIFYKNLKFAAKPSKLISYYKINPKVKSCRKKLGIGTPKIACALLSSFALNWAQLSSIGLFWTLLSSIELIWSFLSWVELSWAQFELCWARLSSNCGTQKI